MLCSNCGADNPEAAKFCIECASPFPRRCPSCGTANPPQAKFCAQCATHLSGRASPASATAPPVRPRQNVEVNLALTENKTDGQLDGERKTVTALFADIKGSMELMEDLDPEEARAIVDPALKLMIDSVHRYDGYIVQSTGDGIFALFGAPVAHEDHPQRALYAALRMQDDIRRLAERLRAEKGMNLQVRVGANVGEVVVRSIQTGERQAEYTPIGHSTSLASRLQSLANPGSIAISDGLRKLVEGYFALKALGPALIKGSSEPVNVYEVLGLGPLRTRLQRAAGRGLTKFVGRQREMEALRHAAEEAQAGHGQIVAVMADPGVGKSRLFYEFKAIQGGAQRASLAGRDACPAEWMVLEALSVSYGKASAYLPVLDMLSQYFEISHDDDDRKRRELILGKVLSLDRQLEDTLPYLYSLQAIAETGDSPAQMDPQIRRRRTLDAVKRILLRESLNQPLMVIFEDLHWIDNETQALLNVLVEAIANAPILLLVNYRPEYRHEWDSRTNYTQLRLDPLGRESAQEMLAAMLGDGNDLTPLKRLIIERTEGTPFFMEEMVQALFEDGVLQRNGVVKLARPISTVKVPTTVQAVIASRIDRLAHVDKELLQTLAVLGHEFLLKLVEAVALEFSDELEQILAHLQLAEFIYEQPAMGGVEYGFKHALTQEVAYKSILIERRRTLHDRTASALEDLYGQQLDDHYSELAHHYLRGNDVRKAVHYAQLAAEQAISRAAYAQTTSLITDAVKLLEKLPEGGEHRRAELALRTIESTVSFVLHGASSKERERAVRRMCELAEKIDDGDQFIRALSTLSGLYWVQGESNRALALAKRCLALGGAKQDDGSLVDSLWNAGMAALCCGMLREAASYFEDALAQARTISNSISMQWGFLHRVGLLSELAHVQQGLGRVGEAVKTAEGALRQARDAQHLFSLGDALIMAGALYQKLRQPELVLAHCEEAIALSEENGFAEWLLWSRAYHGLALIALGQITEGIAEMEAGIVGFQRQGGAPFLQYVIALRAEAIARVGRVDESLTILSETLAHITRSGEKVDHAEILRLKGEVLIIRDRSSIADAEQCFREALEVARTQEAKWWELRTAVSLVRVLRDTNRRDEAHAMLAEIYNWFSEGFDLPDLKDAKALLDELVS